MSHISPTVKQSGRSYWNSSVFLPYVYVMSLLVLCYLSCYVLSFRLFSCFLTACFWRNKDVYTLWVSYSKNKSGPVFLTHSVYRWPAWWAFACPAGCLPLTHHLFLCHCMFVCCCSVWRWWWHAGSFGTSASWKESFAAVARQSLVWTSVLGQFFILLHVSSNRPI